MRNKMSKGSAPRPIQIPREKFDENWDRIFKKPKPDTK